METKYQQASEIAVHKKYDINSSFSIFAQLLARGQKNPKSS